MAAVFCCLQADSHVRPTGGGGCKEYCSPGGEIALLASVCMCLQLTDCCLVVAAVVPLSSSVLWGAAEVYHRRLLREPPPTELLMPARGQRQHPPCCDVGLCRLLHLPRLSVSQEMQLCGCTAFCTVVCRTLLRNMNCCLYST
jgi:hypothetical protein